MPESLSTVERRNPPPRRKSCAACIKAKRRCTLEVPACQRCAQRRLDCRYPEGRPPKTRTPGTSAPAAGGPLLGSDPSACGACDWRQHHDPILLATPEPEPTPADITASGLDRSGPNFKGPDAYCPSETLSLDPGSGPTKSYAYGMCVSFPPLDLGSDALISWTVKNRLQYALEQLGAAHRQMVLENQTPWCHPSLYEDGMPRSMQDAHSSCALWMAKNEVNADVIFRSIQNRVQEIVSAPMPSDPIETIARAQALLLYQIMRIHNGDLRSSSAAEETNQAMEDAGTALLEYIIFEDEDTPATTLDGLDSFCTTPSDSAREQPVPTASRHTAGAPASDLQPKLIQQADTCSPPIQFLDAARAFWRTWIFQESARRTFITVFFFIQCYNALRGRFPICNGPLTLTSHSFTMSEQLWRASDPFRFAIAWRTGRRFVIRDEDFVTALKNARADDVDVFSKMVMSSFFGVNEVRSWLFVLGGDL